MASRSLSVFVRLVRLLNVEEVLEKGEGGSYV